MVFHWSLNDSKSPQVSKNLLSILTDRKSAVVWMVSIRSPISNFPTPFQSFWGPFQARQSQ